MGNKKHKQTKAKEPIKVRFKTLSNGNKSIYLDYYRDGKREYEFLKLYLVPEASPTDKSTNAQTLQLANAVKSQRVVELQNMAHGFSVSAGRSKVNLLDYVKHIAEQKKEKAGGNERSGCMGYMALHYHLKQYGGGKTTFKQVDKTYCMGFIDYLKTAKSTLHDRPLSENTQAGYMKRFEAILNAAISDEVTNLNPFKQIKPENKPKKRTTEVGYLTIDEVNMLAKTPYEIYPNIKSAFLFSCFSGLRFSDVTRLTWDKLQKDNDGNMFINYIQKKTKKQEYLPISNKAIQYLPDKGTAKDNDNVFKLPTGGYVNLHLRQWVLLSGITKRVTFHVARHTNATLLLSLDVPIETVSKILGHSDIKTTQIYAKVIDKNKRVAVDKLDGLTD